MVRLGVVVLGFRWAIYWRWGGFWPMDEGRGDCVYSTDSSSRLIVESLRSLRHGKCRFHSVMLEC